MTRKFRHLRQRILAPAVEEMSQLIEQGERRPDRLMERWEKTVAASPEMTRECIRQAGQHVVADALTATSKPTTKTAPRVPAALARVGVRDILHARARDGYDLMVKYIEDVSAAVVRSDAYLPVVRLIDEAHIDWSAYERKLLVTLLRDLHAPEQLILNLAATGTDG